jgi:hypothetical protein
VPYRDLILGKYASTIVIFAGLLFINLFALIYLLIGTVFLKDTGQKLAHLEKELRTGGAVSEELTKRLKE